MRFSQYLTEEAEQLKDWAHYVSTNAELSAAVRILDRINKEGYRAYLVGGAVRDIILGTDFKDLDLATDMPIDKIAEIWKIHDIGRGKSFGIVVVREGLYSFEISQFRKDGAYIDGRRPEKVSFDVSIEGDLSRRDLTINALAINARGDILDFFDGKKDIRNKILKTVGDPYKRFGEDFLRLLRLPRFAARFDMKIDPTTKKAAQKLASNIKDLAPERIKDELIKAASQSGDKFAKYILLLDKLKLLKFILPEVVNLKWYKENLHHHPETRGFGGTVYSHVIHALKKSNTADPIVNLSVLLHDIGKGVTFSQENGLPKYLQHAKASIDLVNSIADRLKMSNDEREKILFAVGNHMKFHDILKMSASKIAKLVSDDHWETLVAVGRADEFARGETFMHAGKFEKIVDAAVTIKNKYGEKYLNKTLKIVDGNRVKELLNIKAGPKVGDIIRRVTEYIMDNDIDINNRKIIDDLIMDFGKEI